MQSDIDDMKVMYEILLSRVEALQSLANSQSTCSCSRNEMVNLEIELIEERSKTIKLESTISLMAMERDSEITALKCKIKSLDIKLDKCINDCNARTSLEISNSIQSPVDGVNATQFGIARPQPPVIIPYLSTIPSQSPIVPSSQINNGNQDANQPSNFLNNLLLSESREIVCEQANDLNDIPLLPQSSIALTQSPIVRSLHVNKRSLDANHISKNNSQKRKDPHLVAPKKVIKLNNFSSNNKSTKYLRKFQKYHRRGIHQGKTSNINYVTQRGCETFPFRMSPTSHRPPRIALEKQLVEWEKYLDFVSSTLAHPRTLHRCMKHN